MVPLKIFSAWHYLKENGPTLLHFYQKMNEPRLFWPRVTLEDPKRGFVIVIVPILVLGSSFSVVFYVLCRTLARTAPLQIRAATAVPTWPIEANGHCSSKNETQGREQCLKKHGQLRTNTMYHIMLCLATLFIPEHQQTVKRLALVLPANLLLFF